MSQLIVDVSEHDGNVDWQSVKDAGYHAIIRVGFGRFDSGGRLDNTLSRNVSECERLGIPYGFYWYSYATRTESAQVEANQCVDAIKGFHPAYPVYFDSEEPGTESVARGNALAFCDIIRNAGYAPGVYASESWWNSYLQGVDGVNRWVAKWSSSQPSISCDLWQYADAEYVPGIGNADANKVLNDSMLPNPDDNSGEDRCPYCGQPIPKDPPKDETPETPKEDVPAQDVPTETGKLTYSQVAAEIMHHLVSHDGNGGHGYSQYQRWGDGTQETITLSDGTKVAVPNGDFDCSSAVITCWELAYPGCTGGATYTGNMKDGFLSTGLFEWHPMGDGYIAQAGDIYLNETYHTAMCWTAEPDIMMQFSISETGGISGQQGDQTGWESNIKAYANYGHGGWDGKLVYVGPKRDGSNDVVPVQPSAPETPAQNGIDVDGYWGKDTTSALQRHYGTYVDGEVWHQWQPNVSRNGALVGGWICDSTVKGSPVIRSLQADLGVTTDGIMGSDTIRALQRRMGTYVDGTLDAGSSCVQEMQRRLNAGTF